MPPVISIVSKKNSGKTTLLEKLIPELCRRGYRIGTIKHDVHGFDMDREGKDSWRHKQAGAETVVISSTRRIAMVKDVEEEYRLEDIISQFFGDKDLVLTEGYKRGDMPKIEVFRSVAHRTPLHTEADANHLVAIVSDIPIDIGVPRMDVDNVPAIADFIEECFLRDLS